MRTNEFEGSGWCGLHIKTLVPVGIQSLPDDTARVGLLCVHRDDCERVWETEDLPFRQTVCGNDYGRGV